MRGDVRPDGHGADPERDRSVERVRGVVSRRRVTGRVAIFRTDERGARSCAAPQGIAPDARFPKTVRPIRKWGPPTVGHEPTRARRRSGGRGADRGAPVRARGRDGGLWRGRRRSPRARRGGVPVRQRRALGRRLARGPRGGAARSVGRRRRPGGDPRARRGRRVHRLRAGPDRTRRRAGGRTRGRAPAAGAPSAVRRPGRRRTDRSGVRELEFLRLGPDQDPQEYEELGY